MSAKSGTSRMNDDGISAGLLLSKRPPARRNEKPTERTVQQPKNPSRLKSYCANQTSGRRCYGDAGHINRFSCCWPTCSPGP
jgi:hypothetical protein